jgi:hypothetical protein
MPVAIAGMISQPTSADAELNEKFNPMSPKPQFIRCTHTTQAGAPCRAWAIRDSDPPACASHAGRARGGAPPGNQNPRTHGFYAPALDPQELADLVMYSDDMTLDDEIGCARVALRRLLVLLDASDVRNYEDPDDAEPMTHADYARLMGLALQATRTIARLLRDKRALSGDAADGIAGAIGQALDELASEWGLVL